jgi:hypothetical protein
MKKMFEVGRRYYESGLTFEITGKTATTISYKVLQHAGRFNERVVDEKKSKLQDWPNGEAFLYSYRTIEA